MTDSLRTTAIAPANAAAAPKTATAAHAAGPSGTTSFQALLERLQKLAAPAAPPEVTTPDALRDAVRDAESSFANAMDLRRQLEDAFRRHGS